MIETKTINLFSIFGTDFLQNKDIAKVIRETVVNPTLITNNGYVILDFEGITQVTQSCMHALFSQALQTKGKEILKRIEFKNIKIPQIKEVIKTVITYSLN
jgi:hypothetical protein